MIQNPDENRVDNEKVFFVTMLANLVGTPCSTFSEWLGFFLENFDKWYTRLIKCFFFPF